LDRIRVLPRRRAACTGVSPVTLCGVYAEQQQKKKKLFRFSLFCEYVILRCVRIHVLYRVNQTEYAIVFLRLCHRNMRIPILHVVRSTLIPTPTAIAGYVFPSYNTAGELRLGVNTNRRHMFPFFLCSTAASSPWVRCSSRAKVRRTCCYVTSSLRSRCRPLSPRAKGRSRYTDIYEFTFK